MFFFQSFIENGTRKISSKQIFKAHLCFVYLNFGLVKTKNGSKVSIIVSKDMKCEREKYPNKGN